MRKSFLTKKKSKENDRNVPLNWQDHLIIGWMIVMVLVQVSHVIAWAGGHALDWCTRLFCILFTGFLLIALFVQRRQWLRGGIPKGCNASQKQVLYGTDQWQITGVQLIRLCFLAIVCVLCVLFWIEGPADRQQDQMVETVNTLVTTNRFYEINPLTGRAYEVGIPLRLQILSLPTGYAILCKVLGLPAYLVVWRLVPVLTLLLSCAVYDRIGRLLFSGMQRWIFLGMVVFLWLMTNCTYGLDGFGIQYAGWQGVTIRGSILVPYVMLSFWRRKGWHVLLCMVVEAAIGWTLYGLGVCALVVAGLCITETIGSMYQHKSCQKRGNNHA